MEEKSLKVVESALGNMIYGMKHKRPHNKQQNKEQWLPSVRPRKSARLRTGEFSEEFIKNNKTRNPVQGILSQWI